ncbi:MAG: alpha/beta fold hydrolase [Candidatus Tectimicrobiota bacterium]
MEWIETNGVVLRYELSGTGTVPLLLIHELGGSLEFWDPVLPTFQQAFRVLRYDMRGFGMSEKVKVLHIDDMTGDIAGLLDALGIAQPCHVVGPALGAGLALAFAARYPDRVRRMVVSSPATGTAAERRAQSLQRAETVERNGMRAALEQSLARSYPERFRADSARFAQYRRRWLANDPESFAAINRMLTEMDLTQHYARITAPTLVLGCTYDTIRPPQEVEPIARAIPGARYVEVASGHFMPHQTPELFAETALAFLQSS